MAEGSSNKKRYLFVVSTGKEEPKKAFTPFYYAAAAASLGYETYMFFLAEGPSLLKKEVLENLRTVEGEEPLKKVYDLAINNGVKMLCCSTSAKVIWGLKKEDLPPEVSFAGAYTLLEMTSDPNTLVFYF